MNNSKLQDFVTDSAARSRITFGDVRRLQRNYLPGGVSTCEEAEMLIRLDGVVSRADKAWTDWLVSAIVDFAMSGEQPVDGVESGTRERLKSVLAGASTKAARRLRREIRRTAEPTQGPIPFPSKADGVAMQVVLPDALAGTIDGLELAA